MKHSLYLSRALLSLAVLSSTVSTDIANTLILCFICEQQHRHGRVAAAASSVRGQLRL
jgi:hypothetical protein